MTLNCGAVKKYNNRIVTVLKADDDCAVVMDLFTHRGSGKIDPKYVCECDPEVLKFVSLMMHGPNMTHDEIRIQIGKLFKGEP